MNHAEKKVKEDIQNVNWSLLQIAGLEDDASDILHLRHLFNKFRIAYISRRLLAEKKELFFSAMSVQKWTDLTTLLYAGKLLYELDDFESAMSCFERVIVMQKNPNQDIRLKALIGRLESELSIYFGRPRNAERDFRDCAKALELRSVIVEDLKETSLDVQADIKSRLSTADLVLNILTIKNEVATYRNAYKSMS